MKAMVLAAERRPLVLEERPTPSRALAKSVCASKPAAFAVQTCISSMRNCRTSGCRSCRGTRSWASSRLWAQTLLCTALVNGWAFRGSDIPAARATFAGARRLCVHPTGRRGGPGACLVSRCQMGRFLVCTATGASLRGDPVCACRCVGAGSASGSAQGRPRGLRRDPYERHSSLSLPAAVGRATGPLRSQPYKTGCGGVPIRSASSGCGDYDQRLPTCCRQPGFVRPACRPVPGRGCSGALTSRDDAVLDSRDPGRGLRGLFGNRRLMSRGHLAFQCNLSIDGGDLKAFNKARATYSGDPRREKLHIAPPGAAERQIPQGLTSNGSRAWTTSGGRHDLCDCNGEI